MLAHVLLLDLVVNAPESVETLHSYLYCSLHKAAPAP